MDEQLRDELLDCECVQDMLDLISVRYNLNVRVTFMEKRILAEGLLTAIKNLNLKKNVHDKVKRKRIVRG